VGGGEEGVIRYNPNLEESRMLGGKKDSNE
jgi:hypothetical protein